MNNYKLSVVVGVYNTEEKKLRRCIESIINQTYTNLEIILLDDGSNNGSELICDEYSLIDCRINVIHQQNRGAHSKFEQGYCLASGDYITNVDHDDFIELDYYEKVMSIANEKDVDIVDTGFYKHDYETGKVEKKLSEKYFEIDGVNEIIIAITNGTIAVDSWCRVFKLKFAKEGKQWLLGDPSTFIGAKSLIHLSYAGYHWDNTENSTGTGNISQWQIDQFSKFSVKENFNYSMLTYPFLEHFYVFKYYGYLVGIFKIYSSKKKLSTNEKYNILVFYKMIKKSRFILSKSNLKQKSIFYIMYFSTSRFILKILIRTRKTIKKFLKEN